MNSRAANSGGSAGPVPPPPPHEFFLVLPDGSCIPATLKNCRIVMKQARDGARKQGRIRRQEKATEIQMALEDRAAARRLLQELAELDRDLIRYAARFRIRVRPDKPNTRTSPVEKRLVATPVKRRSPRPQGRSAASSWVIDDRGMRGIIWQQSYLGRKSSGFHRGAARANWEYDVRDEAVLLGPDGEPIIISNMGEDWVEIGAGWQAVEDASTRKNAKIQMRAIAPFDADMSQEEMTYAVRHFCKTVLEPLGLPYSAVIHGPSPDGDQRNFHPHIGFSLRPMRRVAPYTYEIADEVRGELDGKNGVQMLRHLWAHSMSAAAEHARSNRAYTGLGYGARDLNLEAGEHLGEGRSAMLKRGKTVWAHERNRIKNARNAARRAIRDADRKIEALTKVRAAAIAGMAREQEQRNVPRLVTATRAVRERNVLPAMRAAGSQRSSRLQRPSMPRSHMAGSTVVFPIQTVAPRVASLIASVGAASPIVSSQAGSRPDHPRILTTSATRTGTSKSAPHLSVTPSPTMPSIICLASVSAPVIAVEGLKAVGVPLDVSVEPSHFTASTPRLPTMPLAPSARQTWTHRAVSSSAKGIGSRIGASNDPSSIASHRQSPKPEVNEPHPLTVASASVAPNPFAAQLALMLDALAAARRARKRHDAERQNAARAPTGEPRVAGEASSDVDHHHQKAGTPQTGTLVASSARERSRRTKPWKSRPEPTGWSTRAELEQRSWYLANPRTTFASHAASPTDPIDRRRLDRIRSLELYIADYGADTPLTIDGEKAYALGVTDGWLARPDIQRELARLRAEQATVLAILSEAVGRRPLDFARHGARFWPRYLDADALRRLDRWAKDDGFQRDVFEFEQRIGIAHDKRDRAIRMDRRPSTGIAPPPVAPIPDGFGGWRDTQHPPFTGKLPVARLAAFDQATGKPTDQLLMLLDLAGRHPRRIEFAADGRLMAMAGSPALLAPLLHGWRNDDRVADFVTQTVRLSREHGRPTWPDSIAQHVRSYLTRQGPMPDRAPVDWSSGRSR